MIMKKILDRLIKNVGKSYSCMLGAVLLVSGVATMIGVITALLAMSSENYSEDVRKLVSIFPWVAAFEIALGLLVIVNTQSNLNTLNKYPKNGVSCMSEIIKVIENLQASGLVVQGLSLDQSNDLMSSDPRPAKEQLAALMMQGRMHGIYFYQDQADFDRDEFARKLGEIGFEKDEAKAVIANLRPTPTPELAALGDRD